MGHDGPLLVPRPGSATNDNGSGPTTTRIASTFSLPLDERLNVIPAATGWFVGELESRTSQSGF